MKRHLVAAATIVLCGQAYCADYIQLSSDRPLPACVPWANPGANKNTMPIEATVRHYDLAEDVRGFLEARMSRREYNETASVREGRVVGDRSGITYANVRNMHFGAGKRCEGPVELTPASEGQVGFVYCVADQCLWVPFICNNVTQMDKPPLVALIPPVSYEMPPATSEEGGYAPPADTPPPGDEPVVGRVPPSSPPDEYGPVGPGYALFGGVPPPYYGPGGPILTVYHPASVPAIPEPSVWGTMVAGLAVVVWRLRGRK